MSEVPITKMKKGRYFVPPVNDVSYPMEDEHTGSLMRVASIQQNELISADKLREKYKIDGSGIDVVVLDTGIYKEHPDFAGRVKTQHTTVGGDGNDTFGHGTNVAGIIGASGVGGDKYAATRIGVAPNVNIHSVQVLNGPDENPTAVEDALVWILQQKQGDYPNIVAVCMSLGIPNDYETQPDTDSRTSVLVSKLKALGVVICIASGNNYHDKYIFNSYGQMVRVDTIPTSLQKEGMSSPANCVDCVSVGCVYAKNAAWSPDTLTYFSQRINTTKYALIVARIDF
jgi:subtilisin family serine protease